MAAHVLQIMINAFCAVGAQESEFEFVGIFDAGRTDFFNDHGFGGEKFGALLNGGFDFGIARGEAVVSVIRNAQAFGGGRVEKSDGWRGEIGIVFTREQLHSEHEVFDIASHGADLPKSFDPTTAGRDVARARKAAAGGFDAGDATESGGETDAAGGVATKTERRTARGDERGFASAAATGGAGWIIWVVGATVYKVVGFEGKKKVGQVGFGDGDGTGLDKASDKCGVFCRGLGVAATGGASRGFYSCYIDRVFD